MIENYSALECPSSSVSSTSSYDYTDLNSITTSEEVTNSTQDFYAVQVDASGNVSECSGVSFTNDSIAEAPVISRLSPTTDSSETNSTPSFQATNIETGATIYLLKNSADDISLHAATSTTSSITLDSTKLDLTLFPNTEYSFCVKQQDTTGNISDCSNELGYTFTDTTPPTKPTLSLTTLGNDDQPTFSFTKDEDTKLYLIKLDEGESCDTSSVSDVINSEEEVVHHGDDISNAITSLNKCAGCHKDGASASTHPFAENIPSTSETCQDKLDYLQGVSTPYIASGDLCNSRIYTSL